MQARKGSKIETVAIVIVAIVVITLLIAVPAVLCLLVAAFLCPKKLLREPEPRFTGWWLVEPWGQPVETPLLYNPPREASKIDRGVKVVYDTFGRPIGIVVHARNPEDARALYKLRSEIWHGG